MTEKHRILAIDDNELNRQIVAEALAGEFTLELADDGIGGLALAKAFQPQVVLLDVMMPGLDGYEVCRRLKAAHSLRHCRVILVSAKTGLEDRLLGYDAGADDYVTKPFDNDELRTKIDFALRTRRMEQMCGVTGELLTLVAWVRDSGTIGDLHSTRSIAAAIAETLQRRSHATEIDECFLDDLHQACVLRDIGLLSIAPRLRARGALLGPDELEVVKEHVLVGARVLNRFAQQHPQSRLFPFAAAVARAHHENFDGSGYPDGLAGERIPLAARIVRVVADVAAQAAAGGGRRRSPERIFDELESGRARQYCPDVVDAAAQAFDAIAAALTAAAVAQRGGVEVAAASSAWAAAADLQQERGDE